MKIQAVRAKDFDFSPYGTYYDLTGREGRMLHTFTASYEDHMTAAPLMDTLPHLGYTIGASAPYTVREMEKHHHTQEAILCMEKPVILCVALAKDHQAPPHAEDVRAILITPGEMVVMNRNVWHDACRGVGERAGYYWLAKAGDSPAIWEKVAGEADIEL